MRMRTKLATTSAVVFFLLSVFASCQDEVRSNIGNKIRFAVATGTPSALTKTSYSGKLSEDEKFERIDWEVGDQIRVSCAQVSNPPSKAADYAISDVLDPAEGSAVSTAHIESAGANELCWGTGLHTFYAVSPSPNVTGSASVSIGGKTVNAKIPAVQKISGSIQENNGNYEAEPDMLNMVMTAKSSYNADPGIPEGSVFLNFVPLTTAIKFIIKNESGAAIPMTSVSLISGDGKTEAPVVNGSFSADLDNQSKPASVKPYTGSELTVSYDTVYPACTSTDLSSSKLADRTVTIQLGTDDAPLVLAQGKELAFTFFLVPTQDFNDLTFKFTKADGTWMSTYLGHSEEEGVFFPRFKKSFVKGSLNHNGAEWVIKYSPSVVSWNAGGETDIDPLPEVDDRELTVVSRWNEGISADVDLAPQDKE